MSSGKKMVQVECDSCAASGIHVGWAENMGADGLGVVCIWCRGTGAIETPASMKKGRAEYTGRKDPPIKIKRVALAPAGSIGYNPTPRETISFRQFKRQFPAAEVAA